jgi:D-alanyl-lipoteichoic acid acyltransferase DltB (MBOAT superfamily)
LLFSITFNYGVGDRIQRARERSAERAIKFWLILGIGVDTAMLGWFKYANFVVENISTVTGRAFEWQHVALPLAISFYTFQKIAYLVDSARGDANRMGLLDFFLFTSFFPQLIAGPIVHYKEVVPQIQGPLFGRLNWRNILVGLVIMSIGLFKKTVVADTISIYVDPLYTAADQHKSFGLMAGCSAIPSFFIRTRRSEPRLCFG